VNSVIIALFAIVWLAICYRLYGRFVSDKLIRVDDSQKTPAHTLRDNVDFYPSNPLVLFGHHFSSIAGAGPIIGPVVAVYAFGYGFSLLWILVGVVLVGAVHDYTTLMISVRHQGHSIPELTGEIVDRNARILFQIFVWIALVFIIAVFTVAAKDTLVKDPRVVIPALGFIPLAILFGLLVNRAKLPLWIATVIALVVIAGLFFLGDRFPLPLPFEPEVNAQAWLLILLLYCFIAAILPVWLLLQPRDYLCYWILALGMALGFVGLIITHKTINAPFVSSFKSSHGPIWPMLFILVACGAVSGFHSLVSSGTTAKQLDRESHGRPVVFGAMLVEGALAILALLAVTAGLAWEGGRGNGALQTLQSFMAKGGGGPIQAFATGFGVFTQPVLGSVGVLFGMTMINAFVLTTLDTSVRLGRFITAELAGTFIKPLRNRYLAALLVVLCAYALAATGSVSTLWKMFGASNQLIAALSLLVVTVYLLRRRRPIAFTLVPALFMLVTTCGALIWQGYSYLTAPQPVYTLTVAAVVLLGLAFFVGFKAVKLIREEG
jgi:carbon starvation protein